MRIPPSRMVAFVDALEARSLLERRHNPLDRRTRALHLTDAGREQLLDLVQRVTMALDLPPGVHAAHSALADA